MHKYKKLLKIFITLVWLINGLFCKLLNLVPRHQQIVARILGDEHAIFFTKLIGVLEILMAVWVISCIRYKWCAALQIFTVLLMNSIELIHVPDLLLFGKLNMLFACIFAGLVYYHQSLSTNPKKLHV